MWSRTYCVRKSTPAATFSCPDPAPVFWFTGLSGAGKSTIATLVQIRLATLSVRVTIVDGDHVRDRRTKPLGFSRRDILINNAEIAKVCGAARQGSDAVFVPIISPYAEGRQQARAVLGEGFYEVYFNADLKTVVERDVKALYAKAAQGEIADMIGFAPTSPYEPPVDPDLVIPTASEYSEQSAETLARFVLARLVR